MKRDVVWSGLEAGAGALLSMASAFIVARIVGPAEVGIGAAAVAVHVVLWVVVNALFADALVQMRSVNDRMMSSAFWASGCVGIGAAIVQAAAGFALAASLHDRRLSGMSLLLAMPLPLVGVGGVIQGLLTRERAYRRLALRTLVGQGSGTAVGVLTAMAGAGGWALVYQQAVTSGVGALALLIGRGWMPAWCMEAALVRALLRVGVPLTASTLVLIARYRLFAVLIGGTAGAVVLGRVHIAFRLVDSVRELLFTALWRLMLPRMTEHQGDRDAMLRQVDRWLGWIALTVLPLCAVMAAGLGPAAMLLAGPNWAGTGSAAMPLVALMAWLALFFPSGVASVAAGHARFALYGNLLSLFAGCAGVLVFQPSDAVRAVTIWVASQVLVSPYTLWANARALGVSPLRLLTAGRRSPAMHGVRRIPA